MKRVLRGMLLGAALVAAGSCSNSTGPVGGTLKVKLTTPNSGLDGAVKLVLTSPTAPASFSAGAGYALWSGAPSAVSTIVVTGTLTSGTILTLQVDDVNKVGSYSATLQQVAAASGFGLRPLSGYSLSVTK